MSLLLCFSLVGCAPLIFFSAGTAAGIGGYKYYYGDLIVLYQAQYIETWDAALKVLEDMNLQIKSQKHDLTAGRVKAKRTDGKDVSIKVKYKSSKETEVKIRVGLFGDQDASMAIKEKIRRELFPE